jgi:hypothetical protein
MTRLKIGAADVFDELNMGAQKKEDRRDLQLRKPIPATNPVAGTISLVAQ